MILRNYSHRQGVRSGNVAVLVAVLLSALLGMVGFAIDGGALLSKKREVQSAADAAAMAAACVLYQHYPAITSGGSYNLNNSYNNDAETAAENVAAANGFMNDGSPATMAPDTSVVAVNFPPNITSNSIYNTATPSKQFSGNLRDGCVEVVVSYYQPRYFSSLWGTNAIEIRGRAVAKGAWVEPNDGVIVLDYDDKQALSDKGGGTINIIGGDFIVNSNDPAAAMITGGSDIIISGSAQYTTPEFDVTGGVSIVGGGSDIVTSPTANQVFSGVHPTPDPLAYLPTPTQPANANYTTVGSTRYLTPGRYTSLPPQGGTDTIVFNGDGIYWFDTTFSYNNITIQMGAGTTGVMIYQNTGSFSVAGNATGGMNLSGLDLSSGDNAVYNGIVFWQPKTNTNTVSVTGNGNVSIGGTFYAPEALTIISGNGAGNTVGSQWVTKNLQVSGNGDLTVDKSGAPVAAQRVLQLVE